MPYSYGVNIKSSVSAFVIRLAACVAAKKEVHDISIIGLIVATCSWGELLYILLSSVSIILTAEYEELGIYFIFAEDGSIKGVSDQLLL